MIFQSYLSPIQTKKVSSYGSEYCFTFNPTLVQFKLGETVVCFTIPEDFQSYLSPIQTLNLKFTRILITSTFNPTLVQFKPCVSMRSVRKIEDFQSYLSPIQTRHPPSRANGTRIFQSYLSPIQTLPLRSSPKQITELSILP